VLVQTEEVRKSQFPHWRITTSQVSTSFTIFTMPAPLQPPGAIQRVQPASAAPGSNAPSAGGPSPTASRNKEDWNADDLQKVVLEYLTKKGFHKAETMLRIEASQMQDATNVGDRYKKLTDPFFGSSDEAYILLRGFIHQSLDIYKGEMGRILWPTFAYMFMDLLAEAKHEDKIEEGGRL
jgi:transcription initiation factor TFIID subunit 5